MKQGTIFRTNVPFLDFWLQFWDQGLFLSLVLVPGSKCVSLALVSESGCAS